MSDPFAQPPVLTAVTLKDAPHLPQSWHAVALLTPYTGGQVYAAEIWYDWALRTMRVAAFGLDGGAVDLLFIGEQFYILKPSGRGSWGPFPAPQPVPPPDWLAKRDMNCQGRGRLLTAECDWWVGYTPNANGLDPHNPPGKDIQVCNWVWVRSDTGLPFRLFFNNADNPYGLPVLGGFAMTHFTAFESVEDAGLASHVDDARASASRLQAPKWNGIGLDGLLEEIKDALPDYDDGVPGGAAGRLVQGLKPAPADAPVPQWSPRLCITGYTLPTAKQPQAVPTEPSTAALPIRVFYDWTNQQMLTRASTSQHTFGGAPFDDMILNDRITYIVARMPDGTHKCMGTQPVGLPRPDWAKNDNASARAVIEDNPVLCPGRTINISVAPNPPNRHFWLWYDADMNGVMFIEVPQPGNVGLVVTDYYSFDHDPPVFPASAFDVPEDCISGGGNGQ